MSRHEGAKLQGLRPCSFFYCSPLNVKNGLPSVCILEGSCKVSLWQDTVHRANQAIPFTKWCAPEIIFFSPLYIHVQYCAVYLIHGQVRKLFRKSRPSSSFGLLRLRSLDYIQRLTIFRARVRAVITMSSSGKYGIMQCHAYCVHKNQAMRKVVS